jgi:tRNA pseudouridine38-40 synthase
MRTLKLLLEYDGTGFSGWQVQPGKRTVQGDIEKALAKLLGEKVALIGAGRTDAGVHAKGQVASFQTRSQRSPETILLALNATLDRDITVNKVMDLGTGSNFHARFSAKSRTYRYHIVLGRAPLRRRYAWEVSYPLDLTPMRQAALCLLGKRNFTAFSSAHAETKTRICHVKKAGWTAHGDELIFTVEADRFLQGLVRSLVGTMVDIGRRRFQPDDMQRILRSRDRSSAGTTAPPHGLCLMEVKYR